MGKSKQTLNVSVDDHGLTSKQEAVGRRQLNRKQAENKDRSWWPKVRRRIGKLD